MVFLMLLISNLYCDAKQDTDALLHLNILNFNILAQNELINDKIPNTQPTIKDTVSQQPLLKRPKTCFTFSLDTVVMPGVRFGFGFIDHDSTSTKEEFVIIHANTIMLLSSIGIFGKVNSFKFPQRIGFYTSYSIGVDYCVTSGGLDPGGSPGGSGEQFFSPYFTFGIGYSFKVGNTSFFRISGDLGLKWLIASITLSYVF